MTKIRKSRLVQILATTSAAALTITFAGVASASVARPSALHRQSTPPNCHPAQLAGSGGFLASFKNVCVIASTKPKNGDLNPYGVAVVPTSAGNLHAGDVLVSNFNNSKNLQGTGSTIMEIAPNGASALFASLAGQTKVHVGLTTALAVFRNGDVVVGSLPTTDGTAKTAEAGDIFILNSVGKLIQTISGPNVNGPWDLASYDGGAFGVLFVTNVLNGTVAANGKVVKKGDLVRFVIDFTKSPPAVVQQVVIASGFPERTDPNALVIGPTGVALTSNGDIYVADTLDNRIARIPDGLFTTTNAGIGTTVSAGQFLNAPLGFAAAPLNDLISANGGNGEIVESTLKNTQPEWPSVDTSGSPPGSGALFGLEVQPGGKGVYFVDDATNMLDIFK